jgi:hypothetical protein
MSLKSILALVCALSIGFASLPSYAGDIISCDSFENCPDGSVPSTNALLALEARIVELEALLAGVSRGVDPNTSQDTLTFTNMNVQVVSGSGTTDGAKNGRGNLIIGYNELRDESFATDPCPSETEFWCNRRTGSHMLVIGRRHNYSAYGGMVVGIINEASGLYASVSGGLGNIASGSSASVSGGQNNIASGTSASVSGGNQNTATLTWTSVSGGLQNIANKSNSSISGGRQNIASGYGSSVSGGVGNTASDFYASVSGGFGNTASGEYASVSGGFDNTASAEGASVSGGRGHTAAYPNTCTWGVHTDCVPPPLKQVFITSGVHNGNLGGLVGADAICTEEAQAAGLPGSYKAWLSDSTASPSTRFIQSSFPYSLVNGAIIADDWAALVDGSLDVPINVQADGSLVVDGFAWTATSEAGSPVSAAHYDFCSDWYSGEFSADAGAVGSVTSVGVGWSNDHFNGCLSTFPLYCFQQ